MFSLDNLAIQYPHAEVERVPVCMSDIARIVRKNNAHTGVSMALRICWGCSLIDNGTLGGVIPAGRS